MKKINKMIGIIAMVAVIVFTMAGCASLGGTSESAPSIVGTWEGENGYLIRFKSDGAFEQQMYGSWMQLGNWKVSGSTINITTSGVSMGALNYTISENVLTLSLSGNSTALLSVAQSSPYARK